MPEKPILFSPEMVRAILAGRKTQTRRVIKPQPPADCGRILGPEWYEPVVVDRYGEEQPGAPIYGVYDEDGQWGVKCPYPPGTVLWVRETWLQRPDPDPELGGVDIKYRATDSIDAELYGGWRPSIHMPREAARLFLRVVNVRAERLQEITEAGAIAEGVKGYEVTNRSGKLQTISPRQAFAGLWDSLYRKECGWDANPWVWVIEFVRCDEQ